MSIPVIIPLLNPNETDTLISSIEVEEGQNVRVGDLICSIETTKSTAELRAEKEGFIVKIRFAQGETAKSGETFCYITSDPNEEIFDDDISHEEELPTEPDSAPEGLRITQPALKLARELKLDMNDLPKETLLTEKWVREHFKGKILEKPSFLSPSAEFDPQLILIYGGGGHGKMVIDLLNARRGFQVIGILDDGRPKGDDVMGIPILGGAELLPELSVKGIRMAANAVGGIRNIEVRINIFQRLAEAGMVCPVLVHPAAYIDPSAILSAGSQVFALAYIGGDVEAGYGCIINTGAIISHDCRLGDYVNISPGAILAGEVEIGSGTLIGMGATINLGVKIGTGARIGNGATVKSDVPTGGVVRAGTIWPER
jgi:acetyltransferase EpsM